MNFFVIVNDDDDDDGPWNSLSTDTDFGTLKRFKLSIKSIDFQKFLHIEC